MKTRLIVMVAVALAIGTGCGDPKSSEHDGIDDSGHDTIPDVQTDVPDDGIDAPDTCSTDEDCDDGIYCNGVETCDDDGVCQDGAEVTCDDSDPCTMDACDEDEATCEYVPLDIDGDGYAAAVGPGGETCDGNDCDDADLDIYPGAVDDECDFVDKDCDGDISEHIDDDADRHIDELCDGIITEPGDYDGLSDCDDDDDTIHVGATEICDTIDQNCDGSWADGGADDDLDDHLDETCGGDDCDDLDDTAWAGAPEICNDGVDQDCDTLIDGLLVAMSDVRVTTTTGSSWSPDVAWSGSEYAVVWRQWVSASEGDLMFQRIAPDGSLVGTGINLTASTANSASNGDIVWTGSEYGLAWNDSRNADPEIHFVRLSPDGTKAISDVRITDTWDSYAPSLVWTGSQYAACWHMSVTGNNEIFFTRIDALGAQIGTESDMSFTTGEHRGCSMAWTGSELLAMWYVDDGTSHEIHQMRIAASGSPNPPGTSISSDDGLDSMYPSLAWDGSQFAAAWRDEAPGNAEIYFQRATDGGTWFPPQTNISSDAAFSSQPSMAATGSQFGVVWSDDRGPDRDLWFQLISGSGTQVGSEIQVFGTGDVQDDPDMIWTGSEYAVVWQDERDGAQPEVYFNIIRTCD